MQWTSAPNIADAPLPQRARGFWKAWLGALARGARSASSSASAAQLPPWFVVGFGTGIAAWFALDRPRAMGGVPVPCRRRWRWPASPLGGGRAERALGWFALALALGCALVWARSSWVAAPRLERPLVAELRGHGRAGRDAGRQGRPAADAGAGGRRRCRRGCGCRSTHEDAPAGLARARVLAAARAARAAAADGAARQL